MKSFKIVRIRAVVALALLTMLCSAAARAEEWPAKPVRIIAPFAPGGAADSLGRLIAEGLSKSLGQQFFVDNRPGAAGMIGSATVATADADGYTLLISGNASHILAPAFYGTATYDGVKGFTHLAYLGGVPAGLFVHPSLNVKTYVEFLTQAKAEKKKIDYVSSGTATYGYLFGAELAKKEGLVFEHIPYKGAGPAMHDLVAGHVKVATISFSTGVPHVRTGALRALGISSNERLRDFADVPTFRELGYQDLTSGSWFALSAPPNLPSNISQKLNVEVRKILETPEARRRLETNTFETRGMSLDEVEKFFVSEAIRWAPVAKAMAQTGAK